MPDSCFVLCCTVCPHHDARYHVVVVIAVQVLYFVSISAASLYISAMMRRLDSSDAAASPAAAAAAAPARPRLDLFALADAVAAAAAATAR